MSRQGRRVHPLTASAVYLACLVANRPLPADDARPALQAPYVLLSLRGLNRTRECIDYICHAILRPDVGAEVAESLRKTACAGLQLECLDPDRPLGLLLVLQPPAPSPPPTAVEVAPVVPAPVPVEPREIEPVAFVYDEEGNLVSADVKRDSADVAVATAESDLIDLSVFLGGSTSVLFASVTDLKPAHQMILNTMNSGTRIERVWDRPDLYAVCSDDGVVSATIRLQENRGYLGTTANVSLIDSIGELAEPPDKLGARHDFSASLQVRHLSPQARRILSDALWRVAGPRLQARDDEPDFLFAAREAMSRTLIEVTDLVFTSVDEATASADLLEDEERGRVRLELCAVAGSDLARRLEDVSGPPSRFAPLFDEDAALSVQVSVTLTEDERQVLLRYVRWLECELGSLEDEQWRPFQRQICESLRATVEAGHLDWFLRYRTSPSGSFTLVSGVHIAREASLCREFDRALPLMESQGDASADAQALRVHTRAADEVIFAIREEMSVEPAVAEDRRFQEQAFGVSQGALWTAVSVSEDGAQAIAEAADQLAAAEAEGTTSKLTAPVVLSARAGAWQQGAINPLDDEARRLRIVGEEAFADHDRARFELRPIRSGMRIEGTFETGFLRWIALQLAQEQDLGNL